MELLTSIVDLDSIQVKSAPFTPTQKATQIEALANAIIDLGGLVNIPVVHQISIDEYELISGYLEYYAYRKACELNPRLPDRMTVFIANHKNQAAIHQQLEVLQAIENTQQKVSQIETSSHSEADLKVKNLESSIKSSNQNFIIAVEQLRSELLSVIEDYSPKPIPPLSTLSDVLKPEIALQVQEKLEKLLGKSKARKIVLQLQNHCKCEAFQSFQSFAKLLDILKVQQGNRTVRLISEAKMLEFIDSFQSTTAESSETNIQTKHLQSSERSKNPFFITAIDYLKPVFLEIGTRFSQPVPPLEAFNHVLDPKIAFLVQRKLEFLGVRKAEKIVAELRKNRQSKSDQAFQSYAEILSLLKVKQGEKLTGLISAGKMIEILDRWNY